MPDNTTETSSIRAVVREAFDTEWRAFVFKQVGIEPAPGPTVGWDMADAVSDRVAAQLADKVRALSARERNQLASIAKFLAESAANHAMLDGFWNEEIALLERLRGGEP